MYAIVDIAGQQFKVEKGKTLFVHRLAAEEGSTVEFNKVLLFADDKGVKLNGLDKATIKAEVLSHLKGEKVIVFKKKRRKGYKVKNGHRQSFTQIRINDIAA